jgi:hypothetical protein
MNIGKAFFAGVVGGVAMTLVMSIARGAGVSANVIMMLGTLSGGAPSVIHWFLGFTVLLTVAGLLGIVYATIFEHVTHRAGARVGIAIACVHLVIAGLLVGALGEMHPLVPSVMQAPGFFMSQYGIPGMIAFALAHIVYGATVGMVYAPVAPHPAEGCK